MRRYFLSYLLPLTLDESVRRCYPNPPPRGASNLSVHISSGEAIFCYLRRKP